MDGVSEGLALFSDGAALTDGTMDGTSEGIDDGSVVWSEYWTLPRNK